MKILAIRGKNLTSLLEFDVDFEKAPFEGGGLFAITGDTGAGKSTLLDAMCVALYDASPRLNGTRDFLVGRPGDDDKSMLGNTDPRSLLRRGTSEGYAEADFRGVDGRRYRSRWMVRRARGKVEGQIQNQDIVFTDMESGERLGGTKTETLAVIRERVGLEFDQFRRAVLLAQGEFAAFLKASPQERAVLLERTTGTEIYPRLSQAAFERARDMRASYQEVEQRVGVLSVLDDTARQALDAQVEVRKGELEQARADLKAAEQASAWHATLAELEAKVQAADVAQAEAGQARAEARPRFDELAAVESVQPLRQSVTQCDQLTEQVERCQRETQTAVSEVEGLEAEVARATTLRDEAQRALGAARQALASAAGDLERATVLDASLAEHEKQVSEAVHREATKADEVRVAEAALAKTRDGLATAVAERDEADRWLTDNASVQPVADEWPRWTAEIERFIRAHDGETAASQKLARLDGDLREATAAVTRETEAAQKSEAVASDAKKRVGELQGAVDGLRAPEAVAADIDGATLRQGRCQRVDHLRARLAEQAEGLERFQHDADARQAEAAAHEETGRARESDARDLQQRLEEATRQRDHLLATLKHEDERAQLRAGEPCPLCGATEHPYAQDNPVVNQMLEDANSRVAELGIKQREAQQAATKAATEAISSRRRETELRASVDESRRRLDETLREYEAARQQAELDDSFADARHPHLEARLGAVLHGLGLRLQALGVERKQIDTTRDQLDKAVRDEQTVRQAYDTANLTRGKAEEAERKARDDHEGAKREVETCRTAKDEARQSLAPAFPDSDRWRENLDKDPRAFLRACGERVDAYRTRRAAREEADQRLKAASASIETAQEGLRLLQADASERREEARKAQARRDETRASRSALFGGRSTEEVRAELQGAVDKAEAAFTTADGTLNERVATRADKSGRLSTQQKQLGDLSQALAEAVAERDQALARHGIDVVEARRRLARDATWIEAERALQRSLEQAVTSAQTLLEERRKTRDQHASTHAPTITRDEALRQVETLAASISELEHTLSTVTAEQINDDKARLQRNELGARIVALREQARVWEELSDLIGSADGKKMQVFAQSLTLEMLIAYANEHLVELSRRYRLMRAPSKKEVLAIQVVDQDMGDEVRSVDSLSGGESFLVSLALALGLSSLSAHRTRIDSLFIDEGFGSLDAETLDGALSALESLQAMGRHVGIISHVPGIAERVGARVHVARRGAGRSEVRTVSR